MDDYVANTVVTFCPVTFKGTWQRRFGSNVNRYQVCSRAETPTCRLAKDDSRSDHRPSAIIVGGGPAGFFTAIHLARTSRELGGPRPAITILEATNRVLQKVRISGGGRCNVTNALDKDDPRRFALNYPPGRGRREMVGPLHAWSALDTMAWFEAEKVPLKIEPSGKVFPVSDDSANVIDALVQAARREGISIETRKRVTNVGIAGHEDESSKRLDHSHFKVTVNGEENDRFCSAVCVSTGSAWMAQQWASDFSHSLVPLVPSLFTFKIENDPRLVGLAGVSVPDVKTKLLRLGVTSRSGIVEKHETGQRTRDSLANLEHRGPILITHWGLSGPAILQLSSLGARVLHAANYVADCVVDFIPAYSYNEKVDILRSARTRFAQKTICKISPFQAENLPNRLWRSFVLFTGCPADAKWANVSNAQLSSFADVLHSSSFHVTGKGEFKEEFVTAGGIATTSISTKTFESKHVPGLYFAGEVINVDGITGGFNFQNAWSSGFLAGTSMANRLHSDAKIP